MKRLFTILVTVLLMASVYSQVPNKMTYQAVIRDAGNALVTNHAVGLQISIIYGSPTGDLLYIEQQTSTTNANGLITIEIGSEGYLPAGIFENSTLFLKTEIDPTGGIDYTISGTTQLLSVPYSYISEKAGTLLGTDGMGSGSGLDADLLDGYDSGDFLQSETDPVFIAQPAYGITSDDITNWNSIDWSEILSLPDGFADWVDNDTWVHNTWDSPGIVDAGYGNYNTLWKTDGSGNPSWGTLVASDIPDIDWSKITSGKPSTLSGYGITDAVKTDGDQTIEGNKTFTGTTTVPAPVNETDAATKAYVDVLLEKVEYLESLVGVEESVTDSDGNTYLAIRIGTQVWTIENLKTTKYNDGTTIPLVTNETEWENLTTPGYCWYNNTTINKYIYGALYNWHTVNTGKLCPSGWHVPSHDEWTTLESFLASNIGGKLKEIGTEHWNSPNTGATNETVFTALPGGVRVYNGLFLYIHLDGYWWSSTESGSFDAVTRYINYGNSGIAPNTLERNCGCSVRCIKDE